MTAILADLLRQRAAFDAHLCTGNAFDLTCEQLRRRLGEVSLESLADRVRCDEDALELLAAQVAVPETWLFRYPSSFETLRDACLARGRAIRMASIGCATGQEPFCMAAAALSALGDDCEIVVDALDRNPAALAVAHAVAWSEALPQRGAIPAWAAPWILMQAGAVTVHERTRAAVRFHRVASIDDLVAFLTERSFDVIFCRNMLIYLDSAARMRVVHAIGGSVPVGGLLFLGHAENAMLGGEWERSAANDAFAWQRAELPPLVDVSPTKVAAPTARVMTEGAWARRPPKMARGSAAAAGVPADASSSSDAERDQDLQLRERVNELFILAEQHLAKGDEQEAQRLLGEVVFLAPQHDLAMLALADLHERGGRSAVAAQLRFRARRIALRGGETK
ncbi:MAG: CheR family methyltransferase [Planctomycetota bacterium]